jgi:glycosyltransferase involved in cell wall biosynthesis
MGLLPFRFSDRLPEEATNPTHSLAYVAEEYPSLSETFVQMEMEELVRFGWDVHVFALRPPPAQPLQAAGALTGRVTYSPPFLAPIAWLAHVRCLLTTPWHYIRTMITTTRLVRPGLRGLLRAGYTFHQAVYFAQVAKALGVTHLRAHFAGRRTEVALLIKQLTRITYSFTEHAGAAFREARTLPLKVACAEFVVTSSDFIRQAMLQNCPDCLPGKVTVIYGGVHPDRLTENERICPSTFTILAVARFVAPKGLSNLIDACAILAEKGRVFECWLVGEGPEGPMLVQQGARLGLEQQVRFIGPLPYDRLLPLYRQVSVVVAASIVLADGSRDGIPTVLIEALVAGTPVVASAVSGIPELVKDGRTGFLVPPGDAMALAAAIERVMVDYDYALSLARAGRRLVLDKFDIQRNVEVLSALILQHVGRFQS